MKHGEVLKAIVDEYKLSVADFAAMLGVTAPTLYNMMGRDEISKAHISLICTLFNDITPLRFGKGDNYFKGDFNQSDNIVSLQQGNEYVSLANYGVKQSNYLKDYFTTLNKYALKTQQKILWYNYVPISYQLVFQDAYKKEYENLLTDFQIDLANYILNQKKKGNALIYNRVVALEKNQENRFKDISIDDYTPVDAMFEHFSEKQLEGIVQSFLLLGEHFRLFVTDKPVRTFSYIIMDDDNIAHMNNKYNQKGGYTPDQLSIYTSTRSTFNSRIKVPKQEFSDFIFGNLGSIVQVDLNELKMSLHKLEKGNQMLVEKTFEEEKQAGKARKDSSVKGHFQAVKHHVKIQREFDKSIELKEAATKKIKFVERLEQKIKSNLSQYKKVRSA